MIPKKIIFCTDFSKNSLPAQQCALDFARSLGCSVIILHVISGWPIHAYRDKISVDEHKTLNSMKEPVNRDLEALAKEFRTSVADVQFHTRIGSPAQEIERLAEEESADLIIMGTHGWSGIRYLLLGSVAESVLRIAKCSVLVVRSPEAPHD